MLWIEMARRGKGMAYSSTALEWFIPRKDCSWLLWLQMNISEWFGPKKKTAERKTVPKERPLVWYASKKESFYQAYECFGMIWLQMWLRRWIQPIILLLWKLWLQKWLLKSILTLKRLLVWLYREEGKVWLWMWLLRSDFASLMTANRTLAPNYCFEIFFLYHLSITIKLIN